MTQRHGSGEESGAERRPGPPSTLDDLRERLIDAATEALLRSGVSLGLEAVRMADAIDATGASRASAYRALADDELEPQERLRQEVLLRILQRDSRARTLAEVSEAVVVAFERHADSIASDDPMRRREAFFSIVRAGTDAAYCDVMSSRERSILTAAYGAVSSRPVDEHDWQDDAIASGEERVSTHFAELYGRLMRLFGHRLRPGVEMAHFSVAATSLLEGLVMRHRFRGGMARIDLASGVGGTTDDWSLLALGFVGLILTFFEPDPDDPRAIDLRIP